jgi:C4-dicarboxylate-binding protein DctP
MNKWLKAVAVGIMSSSLILSGCGTGTDEAAPKEGGTDAPKEKIVLKFSHVTTAESPKGKAADKFKELVEQKTNGQVEVQVFPSSSLYGDKEEMEALQANNVQMIAPSMTKLVGFEPAFQIVDMPFLFASDEAVEQFWDGEWGQKMYSKIEPQGILGLAFWPNGFKNFTNGKKPVSTPADLKGLKFRTQAGKVLEAQFTAVGAGAATIPFGETYTALQQGTVDGQENTFNNIDTQKYAEVQKYLTVSQHGRLDYVVLTNETFWTGLPDDIRTAITEAMQESTEYERQLAKELDKQSFENLKAAGMEITELTPEQRQAFVDAFQPVYDEFGSVIGQEFIDAARSIK